MFCIARASTLYKLAALHAFPWLALVLLSILAGYLLYKGADK